MLSKRRRQQMVRDLVAGGDIGTQVDLVQSLRARGCEVTQATVSRDVRELGLVRRRDPDGTFQYALPEAEERRDPEAACAHMLAEFANSVAAAQNLVVVRAEPGSAPGVGRVIDELRNDLVVGTVAGDDTVIVVAPDAAGAQKLKQYLIDLGG